MPFMKPSWEGPAAIGTATAGFHFLTAIWHDSKICEFKGLSLGTFEDTGWAGGLIVQKGL